MREIASATRDVIDGLQTFKQPQAQTEMETNVVQLERYRAERLDDSVSAVRQRLSELQRARIQAELSAGRLLRESAALQRELRDCRERMVDCSVPD